MSCTRNFPRLQGTHKKASVIGVTLITYNVGEKVNIPAKTHDPETLSIIAISLQVKVRIGGEYSLMDAAKAQDGLASRKTTGKLILVPGNVVAGEH